MIGLKVGPLSLPGGNPAKVSMTPAPLYGVATATTAYKPARAVRPNRRLGARKVSRMAFTPPGKVGAFKTDTDTE